MTNPTMDLYNPAVAEAIKARVNRLAPDATRQWGKMAPGQMLAHCAGAMEFAVGDVLPPRAFIGYLLGALAKRMALGNDAPLKPGAPTAKELVIRDARDFATERARLLGLIDRFSAGGAARCTTHPHTFFGPLTQAQWSELMYKHLDHHLRQFGV